MTTEQWKIGDVTITKIEEVQFWVPMQSLYQTLASSTREEVEAMKWLDPTWMNLDDGTVNGSVNSFLVETPTKKLVVDTGVGNGRARKNESFYMLQTDFLERFSQVWDPAEVDGVVSTHLHTDHVGWNTHLVDGAWVPTFPNATYHFVQQEYEYWKEYAKTDGVGTSYSEFARRMADGTAVFNDSVRPIADAGLVDFVEPDSELTPEVSLVPSFGHTPHHVAVRIASNGESAVITGDLMHYPCQVTRPDWSAEFDFDKHTSAQTRDAFVKRYANTGTLILSAHFGTPTGGHIVSDGDSFKLIPVR